MTIGFVVVYFQRKWRKIQARKFETHFWLEAHDAKVADLEGESAGLSVRTFLTPPLFPFTRLKLELDLFYEVRSPELQIMVE